MRETKKKHFRGYRQISVVTCGIDIQRLESEMPDWKQESVFGVEQGEVSDCDLWRGNQ